MILVIVKTVFLVAVLSGINAAHLRNVSKRIYVGAALTPHKFTDSTYKTLAAQEFNCLTPENEMKWEVLESSKGHPNYAPAETLVKFAEEHKMKVRGHTLIWHNRIPSWAQALQHNKAELDKAFKAHIHSVVTHFKGRIYAWDMVNEALNEDGSQRDSLWHKTLGSGYITEAFRATHEADPNAKLYYNDFGIEAKNKKSDALFKLVKQWKSEGVPIHGVGVQSHFVLGSTPKSLEENLKRFSDIGIDVAITELNIRMHLPPTQSSLEQQAKEYAQVFQACVNVPRCVGITVWGFTDWNTPIPPFFKGLGAANLWDKNNKPKPAVKAVEKVIEK